MNYYQKLVKYQQKNTYQSTYVEIHAGKRLDSLLQCFQRVPVSFAHMMSEMSVYVCMYVCMPYLTLCVLWLVKDRASCSEVSAIWEPYLRTSASFLPRGDMVVLLQFYLNHIAPFTVKTVSGCFTDSETQSLKRVDTHPHSDANEAAEKCVEAHSK